jgi:hypothetical protein
MDPAVRVVVGTGKKVYAGAPPAQPEAFMRVFRTTFVISSVEVNALQPLEWLDAQ